MSVSLIVQASDNEVSKECEYFINFTEQFDKREAAKLRSSSTLKRSLVWENDVFAFDDPTDKHYTNGFKLTWTNNPCRNENRFFETSFKRLLNFFSPNDRSIFSGGVFGMNMYTPNVITDADRNIDDRPYAGWAYGGILIQSQRNDIRNTVDSLELQLGVVGPLAGQGRIQTWLHEEITDSKTPLGWDNQISNTLGLNAIYLNRRNYPILEDGSDEGLLRFVPHFGFSVGTVTNYANFGGLVIFGRSGSDLPFLTIQPGLINTPQLIDAPVKDDVGLNVSGIEDTRNDEEYYIYAGIDFRYYHSNLLVEGKGASDHNIGFERSVYDIFVGGAVKLGKSLRISYKLVERSKEFSSNFEALERSHRFGQFSFDWFF